MKIALARDNDLNIIQFFNKNLVRDNDAITSEEFFCHFGIRAAIKRNQIVVCTENYRVVGALRFYKRKRIPGLASLYQFAIDKNHQSENLLKKMLEITNCDSFETSCPIKSNFNNYYKKTGWNLKNFDSKNNYWILNIHKKIKSS